MPGGARTYFPATALTSIFFGSPRRDDRATFDIEEWNVDSSEVRRLARRGELTGRVGAAPADERRRLRVEATEVVWPLVYQRVTRAAERARGHHRCASAVQRLAPECLDRFHDDVEAVVDDLFAHADLPIANLEGWLTMRMPKAVIEGYRKRRGRRGAPQRPRIPIWLATGLHDDPWLVELAKVVLDWAGVDATAGASLWPLTRWAELRLRRTGDVAADEATVAAEVEVVLTAMRRRRAWYEKNVERPLGRKQAPVWFATPADAGYAEPDPLHLVEPYERDDALLSELAGRAIDAMTEQIGRGRRVEDVVTEVLGTVFGAVPDSYELDRLPGADPPGPGHVVALIGDPDRLERVIAAVVGILRGRSGGGGGPSEGR